MKLGKYLIVSLVDFRRYFSWKEFFANKIQFVQDMNPEKIYYWNNEQKKAYAIICEWINTNKSNNISNIPEEILTEFRTLLGENFKYPDIQGREEYDLHQEIINLRRNDDIDLPRMSEEDAVNINEDLCIKLHKIKANNDTKGKSSVSIGGELKCELEAGEIVYVTELNGKFIDIIDTQAENEFLFGILIDSPNEFGSILVITDKRTGIKQMVNNVISFTLVDNGYIYITTKGKLISIDNDCPMLYLRDKVQTPIQIKRTMNVIKVLYQNGFCRSSNSMGPISRVTKIRN